MTGRDAPMQPGDLFQTNYGAKWGDLHEAEEIVPDPEIPGAWHIIATTVRSPGRSWPLGRQGGKRRPKSRHGTPMDLTKSASFSEPHR